MTQEKFTEQFGLKLQCFSLKNTISITLQIDENDADYTEKSSQLSVNEFEQILPVLKAIKSYKFTSVGYSKRDDYKIPEECEDVWMSIDPSGEYGGHDLEILELLFYDENGVCYNINL